MGTQLRSESHRVLSQGRPSSTNIQKSTESSTSVVNCMAGELYLNKDVLKELLIRDSLKAI